MDIDLKVAILAVTVFIESLVVLAFFVALSRSAKRSAAALDTGTTALLQLVEQASSTASALAALREDLAPLSSAPMVDVRVPTQGPPPDSLVSDGPDVPTDELPEEVLFALEVLDGDHDGELEEFARWRLSQGASPATVAREMTSMSDVSSPPASRRRETA
jgi:hypothetical protein